MANHSGFFFCARLINFFAPIILGSFLIIPILGMAGGITGGILGKMLFTGSRKKSEDSSGNDKDE